MFKLKRKFAKILATFMASVAAACLLTLAAFAYSSAGNVCITSGYLNVRSASSTSAAVVGRLYNGSYVAISGSADGWYKVTGGGVTGWVCGKYILDVRAQNAVAAAKSALGVPYVFGGASFSGMDCSGLTKYAYSKAGITLPHSAAQQAAGGFLVSRANLKPGDLIFFDTSGSHSVVTHCAIYIGDNLFIQAETGSVQKVVETSLTNSYWSSAYLTARRYIY